MDTAWVIVKRKVPSIRITVETELDHVADMTKECQRALQRLTRVSVGDQPGRGE